eukprot:CAMPEP_0194141498 /NCGR_PEP_ID=MMETSP0152-20130528/10896_1 /TAXON_ID=1049557 /ORGANISM="Thalassiothrix antarctica, Strain L6-D1" /LENGTH=747 /DNA_ID=CAMNT_0038840137 /DNA_START=251 /DNA_END=2494 /DNA_ORIENTATION=+
MHRGQTGQGTSTFEIGVKKKFGKNLNKLQKPPAPPITNGASQRGSGSSRNGLLLLSTKRSSSIGINQGSGLLSSKMTQTPLSTKLSSQPLAIRSETYTSAHDALVDAVMGASRNDPQKEPDAWGVAEKHNSTEDLLTEAQVHVPSEGTPSDHQQSHRKSGSSNEDDYDRVYQPSKDFHQRHDDRQSGYDRSWRRSDSDDSWRRQRQLTDAPSSNDQEVFMSRLARERAELKRSEEEARMVEQRERAARRLRELEEKMANNDPSHNPVVKEPVVLEKLSRRNGEESHSFSQSVTISRTLYDPNRPYSSMVGGTCKKDEQLHEVREPVTKEDTLSHNNKMDDVQPSGPVIHLSSYEDRDRGEKKSNATPRMLFDPKSGSMVAVTESSKVKKGKQKSRRDNDNEEGGINGKLCRKGKGRNDVSSNHKKDRRRENSIDIIYSDDMKATKSRKARLVGSRLPRTRGVLFVRDEKGNCCSVDGCEGDQGYGCHAVPGGKIRNPVGYEKFQEDRLSKEAEDSREYSFQESQSEDQILQGYSSTGTQEAVIDWVKPNEKIELLTGVQDSPTLKPTAVPWAPSQAALAAAAAARDINDKDKVSQSTVSLDSGLNHSTEEEDFGADEDSDAFVGLGFDPSNMDSVMSSPSIRAHTTHLDTVDLESLGLGVPSTTNGKSDGQSSNIFAFGSSSTWGSVGNSNVSDNWTMLGTTSRISSGVDAQEKAVGTPSFLSFSSNNTWGTSGIPGFGGEHGTAAD